MKRLTRTLIPLCLCLCMILAMTPTASAYLINSISYPHPVYTIEGDVAYVTGVEWVLESLGWEEAPIHYDLYIDSTYESYPVVGIKGDMDNLEIALDLDYSNLEVYVHIPSSIQTLGEWSLSGRSLKCITFEGNAPNFADNALLNANVTIRHGHTVAGWTDDVKQDYGADSVIWVEDVHNYCYSDIVTTLEPTCTQQGQGIGTCSCGRTEKVTLNRLPHSAENGLCTVCGMDLRFTYNLNFNGTTCTVKGFPEGEGTMIIPETINGYTVTFIGATIPITNTQDYTGVVVPGTVTHIGWSAFQNCTSLVHVTIPGNLTQIGTAAFSGCTNLSAITFQGNAPNEILANAFQNVTATVYYPAGNETWTEAVMQNYGGNLTWVATNTSNETTITLKYPTVSFEDMILMNIYFDASNMDNVKEMGLITYKQNMATWNINNAETVISDYHWSEEESLYYVTTDGIPAKKLGDELYFAAYAQLTDGSYIYSKLVSYSPKTYAYTQLANGDAATKSLMVALLNYGAEAQTYFNYNTDNLVNYDLTSTQKCLVEDYRSDMVQTLNNPSVDKQGDFAASGNIGSRIRTVSFEGSFGVNYYCTFTNAPLGDVTMYYWDSNAYDSADGLTTENATKVITMTYTSDGIYRGTVSGIAAKDLGKTFYIAFAYNDGTDCATDLQSYSIGSYCNNSIAKGSSISSLAAATAVYGYYANALFDN